jgi:hypothetical protein
MSGWVVHHPTQQPHHFLHSLRVRDAMPLLVWRMRYVQLTLPTIQARALCSPQLRLALCVPQNSGSRFVFPTTHACGLCGLCGTQVRLVATQGWSNPEAAYNADGDSDDVFHS